MRTAMGGDPPTNVHRAQGMSGPGRARPDVTDLGTGARRDCAPADIGRAVTHLPIEAFRTNREGRLGDIAATYVLALLRGDAGTAERAIRDAMATTLSTAEIDEEIITPAMWMVGRLWEEGQISVADEHLAAEITLRALDLMRRVR